MSLMASQAPQQCLRAGLLDEIDVAVVPLLLAGVRLFCRWRSCVGWTPRALPISATG